MINHIKRNYEEYLKGNMEWQKFVGSLSLSNLYVVSGITCIGKDYLLEKYNLPSLYSYKTGEDVSIRGKQLYISPNKFYKKMVNGEFFDLYQINGKVYGYLLEDYLALQKEYGKVYINISIENLYKGLNYGVNTIYILDYSESQLKNNIEKRILERNYSKDRIAQLNKTILREKEYLAELKNIKQRNSVIFIEDIKDFEKYV